MLNYLPDMKQCLSLSQIFMNCVTHQIIDFTFILWHYYLLFVYHCLAAMTTKRLELLKLHSLIHVLKYSVWNKLTHCCVSIHYWSHPAAILIFYSCLLHWQWSCVFKIASLPCITAQSRFCHAGKWQSVYR